jgi:integrase
MFGLRTPGMSCRRSITSAAEKYAAHRISISAAEIDRLIEAALRLRRKGGSRSRTYATLIALLSAAGLRISEALKLTVADVTCDGLLIRKTKFRKTRLVPLHDTAVAGLQRYLARRRPCSETDPGLPGTS